MCSSIGTSTQRIFFPTALHRRVIWSFSSTLYSEEANTSSSSLSHNDAPNSWEFTRSPCTQPLARPTQQISFFIALHRRIIWSSSQLFVRRRPSLRSSFVSDRNHTPNSWALSQVNSISLCLGGCLTQL